MAAAMRMMWNQRDELPEFVSAARLAITKIARSIIDLRDPLKLFGSGIAAEDLNCVVDRLPRDRLGEVLESHLDPFW